MISYFEGFAGDFQRQHFLRLTVNLPPVTGIDLGRITGRRAVRAALAWAPQIADPSPMGSYDRGPTTTLNDWCARAHTHTQARSALLQCM